jgi:Transposase DDE domain
MVHSIEQLVRQFKNNWTRQLDDDSLNQACRDHDLTWNDTLLNPITTIKIFFLQILHGNTAMTHLRHLSKLCFTASAYCQARMKIPLQVFQTLLERSAERMQEDLSEAERWLGHRLFLVDGSSFSMPDKPCLQKEFGQPSGQQEGCGFPVAHFLALMHAGTGMITKVLTAPLRTHDMSGMVELHPQLQKGDVLVADRAFCSFAHLALLYLRGVQAVLRIHQRQIVDFTEGRPHVEPGKTSKQAMKGMPRSRWIRAFGFQDQLVEWFRPDEQPTWMTGEQYATLPDSLELRELRFRVDCKGFRTQEITLVTTLVDAQTYPAEELALVYYRRWSIETNFGHLKTTMQMDVLKCETVEGVLKELSVFVLIYNLVRLVMVEAATRQQVDVDRISFIDALRWLQSAELGEELPELVVNPARPNRYEPRVRKRRPKQYPLMRQPRKNWPHNNLRKT